MIADGPGHRRPLCRQPKCRQADTFTFDTLQPTVPIAVIVFEFDPYAQLFGDLAVRWGTIALTLAIVLSFVLAAVLARGGGLRMDDIAFIAVGIVPGAVVGGRLGFALIHWSFYGGDPGVLIDPSVGGLDLGLAVVGGDAFGLIRREPARGAARPLVAPRGGSGALRHRSREAFDGPDGRGPGNPERRTLGDRLRRPGPVGFGRARPSRPTPLRHTRGSRRWPSSPSSPSLLMVGAFRRRDGRLFYLAIGLWALARAGGLDDLARSGSGRRSAGRRHHRGRDRHRLRDPVRRDHDRRTWRAVRTAARTAPAGRHRARRKATSRDDATPESRPAV